MLAITLDIDWSPDLIVRSVTAPLLEEKIPFTMFCTDPASDTSEKSTTISDLRGEDIEIGWHPNFLGSHSIETVIDGMAKSYPTARGWKAHNGGTGWPMQDGCMQRGLNYEVLPWTMPECISPYQPYADRNYTIFHNHFMDSETLKLDKDKWERENLWFLEKSASDNLFILTFHPSILFYDMKTVGEYDALKPIYHTPDIELSFQHKKNLDGMMELLLRLLDLVPKDQFTTPGRYLDSIQING